MLIIVFESYEHVLGPPRIFLSFEKNNFSHKLRLFFNSLIGKIKNVIKVWSRLQIFAMRVLAFTLRAPTLPQDPLS